MMFEVVSIGEVLIDFTPINEREVPSFQQNAGGAPANVVVASALMGKRTAFVGKVGNDPFGDFLRKTLTVKGVETRGLCVTDEFHTTLTFVHLTDFGERSFSFLRNPSADVMLTTSDLTMDVIEHSKIFHFGSVSLTADPSRTATFDAVRAAKNAGAIISFDPNIRLSLWEDAQTARSQIDIGLEFADIVKMSEEELSFLTGKKSIEKGIADLRMKHQPALYLVTKGSEGCEYFALHQQGSVPSFSVSSRDTTGAGDAFMGTFIAALLDIGKEIAELTADELYGAVQVANASGALTTTKLGGIPALPTKKEVDEFLRIRKQ